MAETIDSLEIEISAKATRANNALDKLVNKLENLSSTLGNINTGSFKNITNGVQSLSTAMQGMQNVKKADYNRIAKGIEKISSVNAGNLTSVANALNPLSSSLQTLSNTNFNNKNITSLINSITRLASVNIANLQGIEQLGSSLRGLIDNIAGAESVERTTTSLVNGIARLANAGSKTMLTANALPMLSNSLRELITNLSTAPQVPAETSALASAIAKLAGAGDKTAKTAANLDELSKKLISFIQTLSKAPQVSAGIVQLVTAIANLANAGSGANKAFSNISSIGSRSLSSIRSLANGFKNLVPNINRASKASKGFVTQITMLYAKVFLVIRMFKQLGKAVTSATDYIEEFNYFNVAMGKIADENKKQYAEYGYEDAETYANSFKTRLTELTTKMSGFSIDVDGELSSSEMKNLGLNVTEIMNFESRVAQITNSVGILGEASVASSKALTMLSGDLSSLTNTNLSQVMDNLSSGMTGMTAAVKKYGMDISVASLKQYALDLGIQKNLSSMTQAEKMYLRVIAMLDQSKISWGDLANTINQPANQFRMLKNNIKATGMMIGKLFLPIIETVLPYLNAMTMAVKDLVQWIGDLFGIKWNNDSIAAPDTSGYTNLEDDATDAADAIDKAADSQKKFNKQLQGFDELNNLSKNHNNSDDSDSNDNNAEVSGVLSDALIKAVEDYEKRWNKAFDGMTSKADELKQKIEEVFKRDWKTGDFTDVGAALGTWIKDGLDKIPWETLEARFEKVGKSIGTTINGFVSVEGLGEAIGTAIANAIDTGEEGLKAGLNTTNWKKIGGFIGSGVNGVINSDLFPDTARLLGTALNSVFTTLKGFSEELHWDKMGEKIITSLNTFFSTFNAEKEGLSVGEFVSSIATTLYTAVSSKQTWKNLGEEIGGGIKGFFEGMNEIDKDTNMTGWQKLGKSISDSISGIATSITTALNAVPWLEVGQSIGDFISSIDFGKVVWSLAELADSLFTAIVDAITGFVEKAPLETAIVGLFAGLTLTGATGHIATALTTALGAKNLTLGKCVIGLSLGAATFKLMDSDSEFGRLVGAPITAALAAFVFTGSVPLALGIAGVVLALEGGLTLGQWLGKKISESILPEDVQQYSYDFKWSDIFGYSASEWGQAFYDFWLDADIPAKLTTWWNEDVCPWWGEKYLTLKTKVSEWKTGISTWWTNTKEWWGERYLTLKTKVSEWKTGISTWWTNTKEWWGEKYLSLKTKLGGISDAWKKAKKWWKENAKLPKIKLDIGFLTSAKNAIVNFINDVFIKSMNKISFKFPEFDIFGKTIGGWKFGFNIPEIKGFETGGFPKTADLFYANENGKPEMIGRMGRRTAVANNDQIVSAVSDGVFNALAPVLTSVANAINNSAQNGNALYVEGVSEGDIVRITTDANKSHKKRYGTPLYS